MLFVDPPSATRSESVCLDRYSPSLGVMDHQFEIDELIANLPHVHPKDVAAEDSCPICLIPFQECYEQQGSEHAGVTKLDCGHIFCRVE